MSIYKDQNVKMTAHNTYKNLWMRITESFTFFYSNFTQITSVLLYDENTLINDLKNRQIWHFQNTLTLCEAEFEDMISLKAYLQWTDKTQHSLYFQWQNDWKDSPLSTDKFKNFTNSLQTVITTQLTLTALSAVSVTQLNSLLWVIINTTAAEYEQLQAQKKCFICKQIEHMSVICSNNCEAQVTSSAQIQKLDTTELSKNE